MHFFAWQGARRRYSSAYGNDEQRCHAEKDAVLCNCFDETDYLCLLLSRFWCKLLLHFDECHETLATASRIVVIDARYRLALRVSRQQCRVVRLACGGREIGDVDDIEQTTSWQRQDKAGLKAI